MAVVMGVLALKGSSGFGSVDDQALVPITVALTGLGLLVAVAIAGLIAYDRQRPRP